MRVLVSIVNFSFLFLVSCQSTQTTGPAHNLVKPVNTCSITEKSNTPPEELYLAKGMENAKSRKFRAARSCYRACLRENSKFNQCYWELGWTYYTATSWEKALSYWQMALEHTISISFRKKIQEHINKTRNLINLKKLGQSRISVRQPSSEMESDSIEIMAVGDIMMGAAESKENLPKNNGKGLFGHVADILKRGHLKFANLEGSFCDSGKSHKCSGNEENCYAFRTPTVYAKYLADAGINLLSLANNHSYDYGEKCLVETEQTLKENRIFFAGRKGQYAKLRVKGVSTVMVAFDYRGKNSHDIHDISNAKKIISDLAKKFKIVIVSFHAGGEGELAYRIPEKLEVQYNERRGEVKKFARAVVDAGADLVLGHGPHVLRAMENYKDKLIVYSLGNFLTYKLFNLNNTLRLGMILEIHLNKASGDLKWAKIHPTIQWGHGIVSLDPLARSIWFLRGLTRSDFPKTNLAILEKGLVLPIMENDVHLSKNN